MHQAMPGNASELLSCRIDVHVFQQDTESAHRTRINVHRLTR